MPLFVLGCVIGALVAAAIGVPLFAPWPLRVRYLAAAPTIDPWTGLGPPALELRAVRIHSLECRAGDIEVAFEEIDAPHDWRFTLTRACCPPGAVAKLDGWMAMGTALLMLTEDDRAHLYGPGQTVTDFGRAAERSMTREPLDGAAAHVAAFPEPTEDPPILCARGRLTYLGRAVYLSERNALMVSVLAWTRRYRPALGPPGRKASSDEPVMQRRITRQGGGNMTKAQIRPAKFVSDRVQRLVRPVVSPAEEREMIDHLVSAGAAPRRGRSRSRPRRRSAAPRAMAVASRVANTARH